MSRDTEGPAENLGGGEVYRGLTIATAPVLELRGGYSYLGGILHDG
jgi:hypothetical protein